MIRSAILMAAFIGLGAALPAGAQAQALGDAGACEAGAGPAILVAVTGLKDRKGDLKLELYPPTAEDFTQDDRKLIAAGKVFRRVRVPAPPSGPVSLCIRVPRPGRYALLFTHNRDGRNKFEYTIDGAGLASNKRIGFAKPKVDAAIVTVGSGVLAAAIRVQYLGLFGFGPSSGS
jgi:uncharacterized protein (DUF2141 family)